MIEQDYQTLHILMQQLHSGDVVTDCVVPAERLRGVTELNL